MLTMPTICPRHEEVRFRGRDVPQLHLHPYSPGERSNDGEERVGLEGRVS